MTDAQERNVLYQLQYLTERVKELQAEQKQLGQRLSVLHMNLEPLLKEKDNG